MARLILVITKTSPGRRYASAWSSSGRAACLPLMPWSTNSFVHAKGVQLVELAVVALAPGDLGTFTSHMTFAVNPAGMPRVNTPSLAGTEDALVIRVEEIILRDVGGYMIKKLGSVLLAVLPACLLVVRDAQASAKTTVIYTSANYANSAPRPGRPPAPEHF